MTALRQRMTEDMQLRSLSPRTQESYLRSVSKLAEHYHRSPDKISEEELRQYFCELFRKRLVTHRQKQQRYTHISLQKAMQQHHAILTK